MNKAAILEALPLAAVRLLHQEQDAETRPETPEALHAWLLKVTGHSIPTTSVCPDHCAPFDFVADFFFHEEDDALVLANRGGGKTSNIASLHLANGRWKPRFAFSIRFRLRGRALRPLTSVPSTFRPIVAMPTIGKDCGTPTS